MASKPIQDRLDFASLLFRHLDRLSELAMHLFDEEESSEGKKLATQSSRLNTYYGMLLKFESFMKTSVDKSYFPAAEKIKVEIDKSNKSGIELYKLYLKILDLLIIEAHNRGYLMRETLQSDEDVEDEWDDAE